MYDVSLRFMKTVVKRVLACGRKLCGVINTDCREALCLSVGFLLGLTHGANLLC